MEICLIETKKTRTIQLRIQYLNFDNNNGIIQQFPVILTAAKYKQTAVKKEKYCVNICIEQNLKAKSITLLNSIRMELEPLALKVDENFITSVIGFVSSLTAALGYESDYDFISADFEDLTLANNSFFWEKGELPPATGFTYIDDLVLSPIEIILSFKKKAQAAQTDAFVLFKMFAQAVGVALANIDEANVKLKGIELKNCFDNPGGITTKMISHYKQNIIKEVLLLLGSIDILGNPVGLFSNIGTGFKDLFEKPKEGYSNYKILGFVKGPLEGGIGIVKGAGSLIKNTVSGAFNSLSKITGSVGTGISALTLDEEYMRQREEMKSKKAKHIGQGLQQAGVSIFKGVFVKPVEGAKKGGFTGFLKGTYQGISGLIVKPVTGILDATSKTAEGIKNTATAFDDKPNEKRERKCRVFYGPEKFFRQYDETESDVIETLQSFKAGRYSNINFLDCLSIVPNVNNPTNSFFLILSVEYLLYLNNKKKKREWEIQTNNIASVELIEGAIRLNLKQRTKKMQNKFALLPITNKDLSQQVLKKLEELLEVQKDIN